MGLRLVAGLYRVSAGWKTVWQRPQASEDAMAAINAAIVEHSDDFFGYERPGDFGLEERSPQLFPTNVRPETLQQDAELKQKAAEGKLPKAQFLRFTSPVRTPYPENDLVNARWYPASRGEIAGQAEAGNHGHAAVECRCLQPQRAVLAFQPLRHFGAAPEQALPRHSPPAELERSDYAVSSNIGRTISACRQAVVDIRCCLDWLESQGYEQFGILGTSLGSCYAFIASAHDARLRVNAFNHASTSFGDVVWTGQSTRHIRRHLKTPD